MLLKKSNMVLILLSLSSPNSAQNSTDYSFCTTDFRQQTQNALQNLYADQSAPTAPSERIAYFSRLFLHKPYALTALGEGKRAQYDQAPLYRFDAFDCQTYVETVLALALSHSARQFKRCIQHVRYAQGKVAYLHRHHFTSPDWNNFNQKQGLLQDITPNFHDQNHLPIAHYAQTTIDPASWIAHFKQDKIRVCGLKDTEIQQRLRQLQHQGTTLANKSSRIAYLPIERLVTKNKDSQVILDQIPDGAIIEIVRPNWDLTQIIGTRLNVSHMGLAIREQQNLYFYQASSLTHNVYKVLLVDYLISMLSHPTIKGINIQVVLPNASPANPCR